MAWLCALLMIFQSCTVYKSTPITLDEASKANDRVRIYKNTGEEVDYLKVMMRNDGHYYGLKKKKGQVQNSLIDEDEIDSIKLKDKTLSTLATIGVPIIIAGVTVGLMALAISDIPVSFSGSVQK